MFTGNFIPWHYTYLDFNSKSELCALFIKHKAQKLWYFYIDNKMVYAGNYLEHQIFFLMNLVNILFQCYCTNVGGINWLKLYLSART